MGFHLLKIEAFHYIIYSSNGCGNTYFKTNSRDQVKVTFDLIPILEEEFFDASAASDDERNELNCRGTINTDDFECQLICPGDVEGMILILDIEFVSPFFKGKFKLTYTFRIFLLYFLLNCLVQKMKPQEFRNFSHSL